MNILVTGATRGIGKAIAERLCDCGTLFITGRNEELLKKCYAKNYCVCDFCKDTQILEDYIKNNNIDVLINNAGEYIYSSLDIMPEEDINRIYKTNLITPTKLIAVALPHMKESKWGRIVNIGSISGVMGEANASIYSASKAGLLGLTKALALELAEYNITVNTINPGWVDTDLGNNSIKESEFSKEEIIECIYKKYNVNKEKTYEQ